MGDGLRAVGDREPRAAGLANSSFPVEGPGVIDTPLTRGELLPADDVEAIELGSGPLYERALEVALVPR